MLFNSFEFFLFFPLVTLCYWCFKKNYKIQNYILLAASYFFYGWWDIRFLFLIAITTVVDFNTALLIKEGVTTIAQRLKSIFFLCIAALFFGLVDWKDNNQWGDIQNIIVITTFLISLSIFFLPYCYKVTNEKIKSQIPLAISILSNLSILGFFKYYNFFVDSFIEASTFLFGIHPSVVTLSIILPVGISFYTFQSMSYSIDVYRGKLIPSKSVIDYAAYLSFFPQLVAGPIERGRTFLPQFQKVRTLDKSEAFQGVWLIIFGLFKKIVIADNLALFVNSIFNPYDTGTMTSVPDNGFLILLAVYAFAFQIYADFSGYADIARGTAKILGFQLMINFNLPYIATNPSDFWRRWHISLSSWLKDYLYISLGGNRVSRVKIYRNLFITMLLGGLWHGASITFVLWGAYQGLILIMYRLFGAESIGEKSKPLIKIFHIMFFFQITCLGWLIFRAQNIDTIYLFTYAIFNSFSISSDVIIALNTLAFYLLPLLFYQSLQIYYKTLNPLVMLTGLSRFHIWFFTIMSILALSSKNSSEFLYFAF